MALITRVKEYREKAGLKQNELAELVNIRRETIVHLENGRYNPSLKLAMDIAKVFRFPASVRSCHRHKPLLYLQIDVFQDLFIFLYIILYIL